MNEPMAHAVDRMVDKQIMEAFYKAHGYDENGKRPIVEPVRETDIAASPYCPHCGMRGGTWE